MDDLLAAVGLMIALEGAIYALFPDRMKGFMAQMQTMPAQTLRGFGLGAAALGVVVVWLVRG